MDHDFLLTWMGPCTSFYADPAPEYTDEWGIGFKWFSNAAGGAYTEMVKHPLADLKDPTAFALPDFTRDDRYDGARQVIAEYGHEYAIMGAVPATLFELSWYLRGMERVLEDLVTNKDFVHAYLDRLVTWVDVAGTRLVEMGVDAIWTGDDFGMQHQMIIAPAVFREFFKPRYANLYSKWKSINPRLKIAHHSDGNIYSIIGDFIEIGLDILNPIQPKSMDPARLKKEFGKHLTFWGGVDVQQVLPFGTVDEVVNEVKLRLRTMGKGGGMILCPSHAIQPETPLENILAFYQTGKTYGSYPIPEN
jgi:uroporphyrinogen decarboxylase